MKKQITTCPFCGYNKFTEPIYEVNDDKTFIASFKFCPSCFAEFGFDDDAGCEESPKTYADNIHLKNVLAYRKNWIAKGMPWNGERLDVHIPTSWNALEQLQNIPEEFSNDAN